MYMTRKSIRQGMLDIAFLTANASRLKRSIDYIENDEITGFNGIVMIVLLLSIILQVNVTNGDG